MFTAHAKGEIEPQSKNLEKIHATSVEFNAKVFDKDSTSRQPHDNVLWKSISVPENILKIFGLAIS